MREKSGSNGLRWMAVFGLALAAVPMGMAWRGEAVRLSEQSPAGHHRDTTGWESATEIEVQLRREANDATLSELSQKIGYPLHWNSAVSRDETDVATLETPAGTDTEKLLNTLRADPRVVTADHVHLLREPETEADQLAAAQADTAPGSDAPESGHWKPNDPRYNEQWNFQMVKAESAWEVTKGKGAVVAVIDTGVGYKDTRKGKRARDFKDTQFVPGYDFVGRDDEPNDDQGHGTHVAGTIAESTNNNEGVAGLAFEAKIMPLKVLSSTGSGRTTDIAEAIRWAADHGANVINMSLGGPFPDSVMASACEYARNKGVTIVCAAGNSGREGVGYPAAYKDCIAVSSVGPKGDLSFYSSWGKQVAIAAPGGDKQAGGEAGGILQNTLLRDENGEVKDDYFAFQGTSMASPHVAAIAAMIVSEGITRPDDVKAVLQKSAVKKGTTDKYGAGIVDAAAAVRMAQSMQGDRSFRFWMVVGLFGLTAWVGHLRKKRDPFAKTPYWGVTAFAFGMLFPDWLTGLLGQSSLFNIIGHSILIPGALIVLGANGPKERKLLGLMALGLTMHVGWEFLHNTTPFGSEIGFWQLLPWVGMNLIAGLGIMLSGLSAKE